MKGLELSRHFFFACRDEIRLAFPNLYERMAIGLIGHGSQCMGFDDPISQDHDWGPQFCVFLNKHDCLAHGASVQAFLEEALPDEFQGFGVSWDARIPRERSGVLCTEDWFHEQLGVHVPFSSVTDWLSTSDPRLLWVTNGEIWHDPLGQVTKLRQDLGYYPPEVWLKKVVNKCLLVQVLGPYQISRAIEREETLLPFMTRTYFVREVLHLVFLLNYQYAPFFKWLLRSFKQLPLQHGLTLPMVESLLREADTDKLLEQVKAVADHLHEVVRERFPDVEGTINLLQLGDCLHNQIEDPLIREMQFWNQELVI